MAKRKAAGGTGKRKAKDETPEAVKPSEVIQTTSQKDFEALARRCTAQQETISEASGSMGELIKEAAEKKNLHRGAFALWRKLHRMRVSDPAKLAAFLAHFDYYRTLGVTIGRIEYPSLDAHAEEQGQMFERTEAGEGGDDDGEQEAGTPEGEKDVRSRFKVHEGTAA